MTSQSYMFNLIVAEGGNYEALKVFENQGQHGVT